MLIALRPTQETIDIVAALKGRWHGSYPDEETCSRIHVCAGASQLPGLRAVEPGTAYNQ